MKNKFQEKLRRQILYIFFVTLTLVFVFLYVGSLVANNNFSKNRLNEYNTDLNNKLEELFKITDYYNEQYLNLNNAETYYGNLYKINNHLEIKTDVYIYDLNKDIIFTNINIPEEVSSLNQYINILLKKLDQNTTGFISIKPIGTNNQMLIGKKSANGYSIIKIEEEELKRYLETYSQYVITDNKDHVIASTNDKFINNLYKYENEGSEITLNQQQYISKMLKNDKGIKIYSFILKRNVFDMSRILLLFGMVFVLLIIGLNYFSKRLSKNTAKSLDKIIDEIENIKNNKSKYLNDIKTNDEFEILTKEINDMLGNIESLNMKNTELINLNKQIEIKHLESQFNPHFLYNTLETIRYVMFEDKQMAGDLIVKLTEILRYSISNQEEMVKIKDDMVHIENYLEICKVRFQERFTYTIKLDEKCKNVLIPKLIFQPIIENSIKHNFINKESLSIWITVEVNENKLFIEVEDDGEGIDEKVLKNIKENFNSKIQSTHIGLFNVYRRLKLKYENFDFNIFSRKEIGTKIVITILIGDSDYV